MSACVLDVSLTLSWMFEDEASPENWALLEQFSVAGVVVPDIWFFELANVLALARRTGRATEQEIDGFLREIGTLDIRRDPAGEPADVRKLVDLASASGLSAYDAAYLELARRLSLPLATLDRELAAAARRAGVPILPAG